MALPWVLGIPCHLELATSLWYQFFIEYLFNLLQKLLYRAVPELFRWEQENGTLSGGKTGLSPPPSPFPRVFNSSRGKIRHTI